MTTEQALALLQSWRDAGWLRALDLALARFLHDLDANTPASLLLAAALVSQLESRGHSGLPVAELSDRDTAQSMAAAWAAWLDWPADAEGALAQALAGWPADAAGRHLVWARSRVLTCIDAVADATAAQEGAVITPLVLSQGRLALRRHWRDEGRVAAGLQALLAESSGPAATHRFIPPSPLAFDQQQARQWLQHLFPAVKGAGATTADAQAEADAHAHAHAVDWQRTACALALRGRLTVVTGGPGTGKTWTAARMLVLLQALHTGPQPLRVALAAPTGKAAARLRQSFESALADLRANLVDDLPAAQTLDPGPARTLHALLGVRPGTRQFVHDAARPLDLDLLFVDEASMVHLEMMASLLQALPPQCRLVLLGDRDQLASVEAGAVLGDICGHAQPGGQPAYSAATAQWVEALTGQLLPHTAPGDGHALAQQTVALRHSRRFGGPIGALARAVNAGDTVAAQALLAGDGTAAVMRAELRDTAEAAALAAAGYGDYTQMLARRPGERAAFEPWVQQLLGAFDTMRVLCALREGPWGVTGLNAAIEQALSTQGLIARRGEWYEGRPVLVTRNDPALAVFNGDIGIVLRSPALQPGDASSLRVWFRDGDGLRSIAVGRLVQLQTAWAMTVHKSQGSEFAKVLLVLPGQDSPVLTRELLYTGVTRARSAFTLAGPAGMPLEAAIGRRTRRLSGLPLRLAAAGV